MSKTKIEWADETWNVVTGCTKVSEGCSNCYAERMSKRLAGRYGYPADEPFKVTLHPDKLNEPLKWKKPRRIFVNSMSDLFHEDVPFEFIRNLFSIMYRSSEHIFMILTKRPERMKRFIEWFAHKSSYPREYKHVWLGVSVENQDAANSRLPILLQIAATVRFASLEPLLGAVDLLSVKFDKYTTVNVLEGCGTTNRPGCMGQALPNCRSNKLNLLIVGGETGPKARPVHQEWVRSLRDQCESAGTKFFFKHWGEYCYPEQMDSDTYRMIDAAHNLAGNSDYNKPFKVGKKKAGRELDGRTWNELPEINFGV